MGSMLDLPAAFRSAGLRVWVAPDWLTNGHGYHLIGPFGGVLHHTAGYGLRSVYGEPDARPDVPQPRCNLWTPRPGSQAYDIAVICAGRAWQAGTGRRQAYDDMKAGRFSVRTPDAAARFGSDSDDVDAGWTSLHTLGNEVESLGTVGVVYPERQLDVVATAMTVCVDVLGWPGLGCWAHHRQLTFRKPDMSYRGDIWGRAAALARPSAPDSLEDIMALYDTPAAFEAAVTKAVAAGVGQVMADWLPRTVLALNGVDNARFPWAQTNSVLQKIAAQLGVDQEILAKIELDLPDQPPPADPQPVG